MKPGILLFILLLLLPLSAQSGENEVAKTFSGQGNEAFLRGDFAAAEDL